MTALSGGDRRGNASSPMSSVLERPDAGSGERAAPRPLDQIFPPRAGASRGPQMEATWTAFCADMDDAVRAAIDASRSPPEIAYAIGEIVHNYFRTRGLTLTSFELRRLVVELLAGRDGRVAATEDGRSSLVTFERESPADSQWTGDETVTPVESLPDTTFRGPPSPLVTVAPRPLDEIVATVRGRLGLAPGMRPSRQAALAVIASVMPAEGLKADERERLSLMALSELCGLGLIDRIWADRTVRAVFVNAPDAVWVERDGKVEPAAETFRDQAHLLELVSRLTRPTPAGVASFRLRDGSEGTVVFPPAAPAGPVLALRRGEPGLATFDRLVAAGVVNRPIADLLRMAARGRLNVAIVGPEGSGKTALLAAILRDTVPSRRVVSLARHREFRWPAPGKIELVAASDQEAGAPFAVLTAAAEQFRPDLVIIDSVRGPDRPVVEKLLSRSGGGAVAAVVPEVAKDLRVDVLVRLGRAGDGLFRAVSVEDAAGSELFTFQDGGFHRRTTEPAFADTLRQAGYGDALVSILG